MGIAANLRADLHNTSARQFSRHFQASDFLPGADTLDIEARVKELVAQGFTPTAACAIATSTQSKETKRALISETVKGVNEPCVRTRSRRRQR